MNIHIGRSTSVLALAVILMMLVVACSGPRTPNPAPAPVRVEQDQPAISAQSSDSLRWMEEDPKRLQEWLRREAAVARGVLDGLLERSRFADIFAKLNTGRTKILHVAPTRGGDFVLLHEAGHASNAVEFHPSSGAKTLLLEGSADANIHQIYPSPDGRYLAYVETRGGSEAGFLRIFDVRRRRTLDESADRIRFARLNWWPDKPTFFFTRYPVLPAGAPDSERYLHATVMQHTVGTSFDTDVATLGSSEERDKLLGAMDIPEARMSPDARWVIAYVVHGAAREISVLVKEARDVGQGTGGWTSAAGKEDEVTAMAVGRESLYLLSEKGAPNGRVLRIQLLKGVAGEKDVVIPESAAILQDIAAGSSGLYASAMTEGVNRLLHVAHGTERTPKVSSVSLPQDVSVAALVASPRADVDVAVRLEGWFQHTQWVRMNGPRSASVGPRAAASAPEHRGVARRTTVRSKDGTEVPVTILSGAEKLNGPVPTILHAYGSYGNSLTPQFYSDQVAWVQRGGLYVIVHVRGGGEKGVAWHRAGQKENKHKGIEDFIAAAEYVSDSGLAGRNAIIALGGSAGGTLVGPAVVQRPELFAGAIFQAAILNPVRLELLPVGPANVPEFGSAETPEGLRVLQAMDAYEQVRAGVKYPNLLLMVGANDARVAAWQSAKFAERVRVATQGKTTVLVRVAFNEGHGGESMQEQFDARYTDAYAFAWLQATHATSPRSPSAP